MLRLDQILGDIIEIISYKFYLVAENCLLLFSSYWDPSVLLLGIGHFSINYRFSLVLVSRGGGGGVGGDPLD
jgi:hypothetical protein